MATYNEQFPYADPRLSEIDPINPRPVAAPQSFGASLGASVRRALPTDGGGLDMNQFQADLESLMGGIKAPQPEADTQWGDSLKNIGAGLVDTGAMATGALEYGARQMLGGEDQSFVTDRLAAARRGLTDVANDITASMSPEAQDRLARQWDTLDPNKTIWQGGAGEVLSAVGYKLGRSLPSTLVTLLPAARFFRAGMSPGAIAYLGASEGGLSMGGIANNIAQEIEGMTEDELRKESPRYQQMLGEGLPAATARQRLIEEAQGAAPLIGGATVGAISSVAGRYLEPVFVKEGMPLGRRALTGFASEAAQETPQSGAEQLAQNIAAQVYDSDRSPYEGVPNAMIEGGAVGGLMGGGFSAVAGSGPQARREPAPAEPSPAEQFVDPAVAAAIKNSDLQSMQEAELAAGSTMAYGQGEMFGPPPGQPDILAPEPPPSTALTRNTDIPYAAPAGEPLAFGGTDPAGFALRQDQFQFSYPLEPPPTSTALTPPPGGIQMPLGLRETQRVRGEGRGVITPTPAVGPGPMADQSAPPEFSNERILPDRAARLPLTRADVIEQDRARRYAGTVRDENQTDMFAAPEAGEPGVPPAGPAAPSGRQQLGFRVIGRGPDGSVRYDDIVETREEAQAAIDSLSRNEQGELTSDDTMFTVEPVSELVQGQQAPDQPTAEPMVDLQAQQDDLADPDSPRMGVYLSRDNVAELRKQGTLDQVRSRGVPLMNFDLKGGTLIAKNRQVADELLAMRKQGLPMQEILGLATRAGNGKPANGRIVVQQRDENGGVTRESLVATEQEADALAAQWDQEDPSRETVILRADAALARRATKVAQEERGRAKQRGQREAQRAVSDIVQTLPEDVQEPVRAHAASASTRAEAADLMAEAAQVADETAKRRGSFRFESPDHIRFRARKGTEAQNTGVNEKYRRLFDRYETLLDEEIALGMSIENRKPAKFKAQKRPLGQRDRASEATEAAQTAKRKTVAETLKRMRKVARERADVERSLKTFKQAYEYETTASDIAKAAEKVDASAVRRRAASANITMPARRGADAIGDLKSMTDEQVDALSEGRLDETFLQAANFLSGLHVTRERDQTVKSTTTEEGPAELRGLRFGRLKPEPAAAAEGAMNEFTPSGGTIDDFVAAYPTPSEQKKLIKRAQRLLRRQEAGRKGKIRPLRVGRSRINITSLIVDQQTNKEGEVSAKEREANRAKASAAFKELGRTVRSIERALVQVNSVTTEDVEDVAAGRAHLRNLYQLAIGLLRSGDRSVAATKAAEKFTKAIDEIIGSKKPEALARRLAELGRREMIKGEFARGKPKTFRDAFRAFIRGDLKSITPFFRAMTRTQLREVLSTPGKQFLRAEQRARLAAFETAAEKWLGGAHQYYKDYIQPVLVNQRQNPLQAPTEQDIKRVRTALLWIGKSPQYSAMITDPIIAQLKEVGFTFKENGTLSGWEQSKEPREHFGRPPIGWAENEAARARAMKSEGLLPQGVYRSELDQARDRIADAYNRSIGRLFKDLDAASTPGQVSLAEERFYNALRRIGMWKDPATASLLPADARSYNRRVGPRLARKELSLTQAITELRNTFMELERKPAAPSKLVREAEKAKDPTYANITPADFRRLPRAEQAKVRAARIAAWKAQRGIKLPMVPSFTENSVDEAHRGVAERMVNFLSGFEGDAPKLGSVLRALDAHLPTDSPYRETVKALLRLPNLNDMNVIPTWDADTTEGGSFFHPDEPGARAFVSINLHDKFVAHPDSLVHTIVHEMVHAATVSELIHNDALRGAWQQLKRATYSRLNSLGVLQNDSVRYGDTDVLEFVAEVFTNKKLQDAMKAARVESFPGTLWERVVSLVRRLLGIDQQFENLLDVAMSLRDLTFTGREYTARDYGKLSRVTGRETTSLARVPYTGIESADNLIDRFRATKAWRGNTYDFAVSSKEATHSVVLSAMTLSQIHDFFSKIFNDVKGSALTRYYSAFSQRNADNSKNMEEVDRLSRKWTTLTEEHGGEQAANFSRLLTQATVHAVHPDLPLTHESNAHLKTKEQRAKHAELAKLYQSLPAWHKHYAALKSYYAETHDRQQALAVLNALRAYLTTGKGAPMTVEEFDSKYNEKNVLPKKLNTKKGLKAEFGDLIESGPLNSIAQLGSLRTMSEGPYFPLKRFGKYTTYAKKLREVKHFDTKKELAAYRDNLRAADPTVQFERGADGLTLNVMDIEFRMAETPTQARQDYEELVGLYGRDNVKPINLRREEFNRAPAIAGSSGLKRILDRLEGNAAAQAAIKNFYLASLAESSFRKHERQRQNTRGFRETEQHRTFATYSKAAAYYMSQLRFGWKMADARSDIGKLAEDRGVRAAQVAKEIRLRDEMTVEPEEISTVVQKASEVSQFMLLSSVSYWMVNMTQPYLVTQPYLGAKYGQGAAARALAKAQGLIADPLIGQAKESWLGLKALKSKTAAENAFTVIDQVEENLRKKLGKDAKPYLDMLQDLRRQSIIDLSFVAELRQIADGKNTNTRWQRTLDATRIMAHLTEVNNRVMTAIAAYDLARGKGLTHELAVAQAEQAVEHTQFNYSGANAPRLFQQGGPLGKFGPLAFQFMKYPQHLYALMARQIMRTFSNNANERKEALRVLGGLAATHFAVGGLLGVTLQPLKLALGLIIAGLNDDDDLGKDVLSGATFDRWVRELSYGALGEDLGRAVSKGPIGTMLGTDLSSRMSLGSLYFMDLNPESAETLMGSAALTFGGPAVNLLGNAYGAAQYLREGDVWKAIEATSPKFLKDFLKAARFSEEGITGRDGTTYLGADDFSFRDAALQGVGFGTMKAAESFAQGDAIRAKTDAAKGQRARLIRHVVNAETPEERAEAIEKIREFGKSSNTPITRSDILKAMRRRVDRNARIGEYGADLRGANVLYADEGEPYEYGEEP